MRFIESKQIEMQSKTVSVILFAIVLLLAAVIVIQVRLLYHYLRRSAVNRITLRQTVAWPLRQPVVMLLGDSRVSQWEPLPQVEGFDIVNLGQNGLTSSQMLFQLLHLQIPKNVRGAVIQVGINDLKAIGFSPQQADAIAGQCRTNIAEAVDLLRAEDIQVVLLPVIPTGKPTLLRRSVWSEKIDTAVADINDYLKTLQQPGVIVLQIDALSDADGRLKSEYRLDTLHLNRTGYQALNELVNPVLNETFLENES